MNAQAAPLTAARTVRIRWALLALAVVLFAAAAIAIPRLLSSKSSATSALSTSPVARKTIAVTASGTGSTVAANSVTVNPQISGTVDKLYVSLGETVTAGEALYTISSDDVETQLLQAKTSLLQAKQSKQQAASSYQQAKNQLYSAQTAQIKAEQDLARLESQPATAANHANDVLLAKRALTSAKASVTSAKAGVSSASTGVHMASAAYTSSAKSYDDALQATNETVVTAPMDGVITAMPLSVGSAVTAGTNSSASSSSSGGASSASAGGSSASGSSSTSSGSSGSSITIADLTDLEVDVSVSEVDVPTLATGQKAEVTFDALPDKTFEATVKSVSPNGTTSSGVVNYTVRLTLDAQDPRLKPDMTATADIKTQVASNVLTVPTSAVKSNGDTKYVMVVDQGGATKQQIVTVGLSDDSFTEIKSGLTQGAIVALGTSATGSGSSGSSSSSSSSRRAEGGFMMGAGGPPSGGPGGN